MKQNKKRFFVTCTIMFFIIVTGANYCVARTTKVPVDIQSTRGNAGECFRIVDSDIKLNEKDDYPQAIVTIKLVKTLPNIKKPELRGLEIGFVTAEENNVNVLKYFGDDEEYQKINQAMRDGNLNQQFKLKFRSEPYDEFYVENYKSLKKAHIARAEVVEAKDLREFSAYFRKFQRAYVKPSDIAILADLTHFPFGINHSTWDEYTPSATLNREYPNTKQGFIEGGYGELLHVNPSTGMIEFDIRDARLDIINPDLLGIEQKISSDKTAYAFAVIDIYKLSTAADYVLSLYVKKKKGKFNPESASKTQLFFKKVKDEYKLVDVIIPG